MYMHNEKYCQKLFVKLLFIFLIYQKCITYHQYSPVALSVDTPQLDIRLGLNCSCTRGPVDQCQLPETASLPNAGNPFIVDIHLKKQESKNLCNILHGETALIQKNFFAFSSCTLTWNWKKNMQHIHDCKKCNNKTNKRVIFTCSLTLQALSSISKGIKLISLLLILEDEAA